MQTIEHHIQRTILERLSHAASLRFSELKPEGMESNIFMYHLKQLIRESYVAKIDAAYCLTSAGLSYIDSLSATNHKPSLQPKVIAILALEDEAGRWLLAERKIQPYLGTCMFPSGKQHRGETQAAHASRELYEKTGLQHIELSCRGHVEVLVTSSSSSDVLTHVLATVYSGRVSSATAISSPEHFTNRWYDMVTDDMALMPGTREVYDLLQTDTPFETSLRVTDVS